jgi:1,6-anhydro-N-acetylmuramate kinase
VQRSYSFGRALDREASHIYPLPKQAGRFVEGIEKFGFGAVAHGKPEWHEYPEHSKLIYQELVEDKVSVMFITSITVL